MNASNSAYSLARQVTTPLVSVALAVGGLALMAGCASEPESHVVSAPPPNVVTPAITTAPAQVVVTQSTTPSGTIVLSQAPPAAPQVVVAQPARPSSDYVWIEGHWTYRNERYEWINGAWERPPYSRAVWYPPHSESRGDGSYLFVEGHWSEG